MARLNTRSQTKRDGLQKRVTTISEIGRNAADIRSEFQDSPPTTVKRTSIREQWTTVMMGGAVSNKGNSGVTEKQPTQTRNRLKRTGTLSDLNFDIFADSDGMSERGDGTPKGKKASPLKLARANSLILPLPQAPRTRTSRKSELYNYDKENDPVEEEPEQEQSSLSRNPSDASSTRRSPTRTRIAQPFTAYRQPEHNFEDESVADDSFDSLDDFIVSDNEELSYHETSDSETEEEEHQKAPSPPQFRKRLLRGRRPDPTAELEKALRESPKKNGLRLEPSLPAAVTIPSTPLDKIPRRLFHDDNDVSERMDRLKLDDYDPASQLQHDLFEFTRDPESPRASQPDNCAFQTPPSSPSKGLRSPTKQRPNIPPTPYRESADAFWSQEITNDWIDQHSPRKEDLLLREFAESDCEVDSDFMPRRQAVNKAKTPSKTALKKAETEAKKAALALKKAFDSSKAALAEDFLKVLDDAVSGGQVQKRSAETGGVRIIWSKTLQTTAGRASWKRDKSRSESPLSASSGSDTSSFNPTKHFATIELAERIIDNEDRLINTLAHEYCHLANFIVSNVHNNPHGASFQKWGRKCKEALKNHPVYGGRIEVTTRHSYKIDYKYVWTCVDCGQSYGRHSKSIDPTKCRCGKCKGLLQQIKPKPRNVSPRKKPPVTRVVDDVARVLGDVTLYTS